MAHRFRKEALTGWNDDKPRTILLDLGKPEPVRRVVVWSFSGGKWGIFAPRSVAVARSPDGVQWQPVGVTRPAADLVENGSLQPLPLEVQCSGDEPIRWIRVTVQHARGWTMLSEIVVK